MANDDHPHKDAVVIFGAGATKACGGLLTDELLWYSFSAHRCPGSQIACDKDTEREQPCPGVGFREAARFLSKVFEIPDSEAVPRKEEYPGLTQLLSLVDTAIARNEPFGKEFSLTQLREIRRGIDWAIYKAVPGNPRFVRKHIEPKGNYYFQFLKSLYGPQEGKRRHTEPHVISLNYDTLADVALLFFNERYLRHEKPRPVPGLPIMPRYGTEMELSYDKAGYRSWLLKMHGSQSWFYCPRCHGLTAAISWVGEQVLHHWPLTRGKHPRPTASDILDNETPCRMTPGCTGILEPILITPSHLREYRNLHLLRVWSEAERMLRTAREVYFVGYSLPEEDHEFIYVLKHNCVHIKPDDVHVIGPKEDPGDPLKHEVYRRYVGLFGKVKIYPVGLENWTVKTAPFAY